MHFVVARLAESCQVPSSELVLRVEAPVQYVVDNKLLTASTQDAAALLLDMLASELFPFFGSQELHRRPLSRTVKSSLLSAYLEARSLASP